MVRPDKRGFVGFRNGLPYLCKRHRTFASRDAAEAAFYRGLLLRRLRAYVRESPLLFFLAEYRDGGRPGRRVVVFDEATGREVRR